jgi:hypothetical protein
MSSLRRLEVLDKADHTFFMGNHDGMDTERREVDITTQKQYVHEGRG